MLQQMDIPINYNTADNDDCDDDDDYDDNDDDDYEEKYLNDKQDDIIVDAQKESARSLRVVVNNGDVLNDEERAEGTVIEDAHLEYGDGNKELHIRGNGKGTELEMTEIVSSPRSMREKWMELRQHVKDKSFDSFDKRYLAPFFTNTSSTPVQTPTFAQAQSTPAPAPAYAPDAHARHNHN